MGDIPDYSVQPRPEAVEGARSVHDLVAADLRRMFHPGPALEAALAGVLGRKEYGLSKYGTVLHTENGRDYLVDLDDEVGDLVAYLRALIIRDPELAQKRGLYADYNAMLIFMTKVRCLVVDAAAEARA